MKDITLKQIAETLGISITTVSKALKDYPDVSSKTKKSVLELASSLQYTPNSFAVNLRTKESKTIGLIIPEVVHHFFSNVINGIIEEAEKSGYLVIILQSNESLTLEKKQVELLINKRVDGIIMSLSIYRCSILMYFTPQCRYRIFRNTTIENWSTNVRFWLINLYITQYV